MSDFKSRARFVRINDDVYARAEIFESLKGAVLISDEEARAYFEPRGANLVALGLNETRATEPDAPDEAPAPKKGRGKKDATPVAVVADAPLTDEDLEKLFSDEND